MKVLGLDIGTTTISTVVYENNQVIRSITRANNTFFNDTPPWEKIQDPECIRRIALDSVEKLFKEFPDIERIGITGQMHGIVYLDSYGRPVSPLYTWQDGRGNIPMGNSLSYAEYLTEITGYQMATGYGLTTHFYNVRNRLVPKEATVFCTIHDYIAMVLCENAIPTIDPSDAASFGLFNVEKGCYDLPAIQKAGMDVSILPPLASQPQIGTYRERPVYVGIGDNQASFIGATGGSHDSMLVNVGTGSQFSVFSEKYIRCIGLDTRPFPGGGYLLVGASLCGGRAYALLEKFFRLVGEMLGCTVESAYESMSKWLAVKKKPEDLPKITPLFEGTRLNPTVRGSIENLSTKNFTPESFIWAMMEGMAAELYEMYRMYLAAGGTKKKLVGSGNGLHRNEYLQDCVSRAFGQKISMSQCEEEAATGAAMFAAMH